MLIGLLRYVRQAVSVSYKLNDLTKLQGGQSEIYMNLFGVGIGVDVILATPEQVEKYKNINYLVIAPAIREGKEVYHT